MSRVVEHVCREMLTIQLPSLEFRHSSSEEDILSTEDMDSTADDLDEVDNEELAITFDLPGNLLPPLYIVLFF